jgi:hypothetical protein
MKKIHLRRNRSTKISEHDAAPTPQVKIYGEETRRKGGKKMAEGIERVESVETATHGTPPKHTHMRECFA